MLKAKPIAVEKKKKKSAKILAHFSTRKFRQDNLSSTYNNYYSSGFYKKRYPRINQCTAKFIEQHIDKSNAAKSTEHATSTDQILDYGCGNGRYLTNLLARYPQHHFTAYDISPVPLKLLKETLEHLGETSRVNIISDFDALYQHIIQQDSPAPINTALLLFGVLSHIASPIQRQEILTFLRQHLNSDGHLILSVPNKRRRFLKLQRQQGSHEITYQRTINKEAADFYYHLYSVETIIRELTMAGLTATSIKAESLLPESYITKFPALGWFDRQLCRWLPASWGYGILVSCKPTTT